MTGVENVTLNSQNCGKFHMQCAHEDLCVWS